MEVVASDVGGGVKGAGDSATTNGSSSSATARAAKRRKVELRTREDKPCNVSADSECVVQCERCKDAVEVNLPAENFGAPVAAEEDGERCLSGDVEDPGSASCCSSNESSKFDNETIKSLDLELKSAEVDATAYQSRRERKLWSEVVAAESDDDNSAAKPMAANSRRRQVPVKMPSQAEIDDFFCAAEKKTVHQFKEKYNFDFEKEEPLTGRYEWKPQITKEKITG